MSKHIVLLILIYGVMFWGLYLFVCVYDFLYEFMSYDV
jgi:hypothetical protein